MNRNLARLDFCSFSDLEVSNITTQREVKWLGKLSQKQSREPHQITSNIIWRWWRPFQCAIAHAVVAIGSELCEQITRTRIFCPMESWPWRPPPPVPATSENSVNFSEIRNELHSSSAFQRAIAHAFRSLKVDNARNHQNPVFLPCEDLPDSNVIPSRPWHPRERKKHEHDFLEDPPSIESAMRFFRISSWIFSRMLYRAKLTNV